MIKEELHRQQSLDSYAIIAVVKMLVIFTGTDIDERSKFIPVQKCVVSDTEVNGKGGFIAKNLKYLKTKYLTELKIYSLHLL